MHKGLEARTTGYGLSGIQKHVKEYAAANLFSDNWIDVEWPVENGAVHAHISNRTKTAMIVDAVIVGAAQAIS